ncbi:DNA mismatch repair protein MutS [Halobacteroides halobius DSM 5150]|uniref:DNA mismatch repair protein MutS n=1 Tax=Halobacteroides halobius (strain ATCC 35273 / DSM 5150 / MD-1) TaxID=748449 RepID=L0K8R1_HALHC|nr:DNA mismatch repair protein MutS [Halobacteroides halobius]AGB40925.1 DNA mismatch repair protein MutS [Halobacteroides halobius DSM 5150]
MSDLTPLMQQYFSIKDNYQEEILFFRLGDFYEMFAKDAQIAARELELTLTARNKGSGEETPMAGVPCKSAESYIAQLIEMGYKVAICEQVEDPKATSGLVKREVVRVVTPGTVVNNDLLEDKDNNYLAAIIGNQDGFGFAVVDVSTGEFVTTQLDGPTQINKVIDELSRINPAEILLDNKVEETEEIIEFIDNQLNPILSKTKEGFTTKEAYRLLTDQFDVVNLEGFGCEELPLAIQAAGAILDFLVETQKRSLNHINQLATYSTTDYMVLDANTRRNLELTQTMRDKSKRGSLLWVLDQTVTAMGGRKLKKWVEQPLLELDRIEYRLDAVEEITKNIFAKEELKELLTEVYDIERLLGKIIYGSANARDLISLKSSLHILPEVKEVLDQFKTPKLKKLQDNLDKLEDVACLIENSIKEDPPTTLTEGSIIKKGYDNQLDELLEAMENGKQWIIDLQKQERERTGISSLKVGHNKVHGYYIEVTKANLDAVPEDYVRKQTLSNSERYITPELKDKESVILGAQENSKELEYKLFVEIRDKVAQETERIQKSATILAQLDALLSLAEVALNNDYTKPQLNTDDQIDIEAGRHPVVEEMMEEEVFVPNDTYLDQQSDRFGIITGPNMSGKSTYMRQVALIVLLAQIGSFVPADKAKLSIVDRIFTRVGASDDLTTGQSTFMVEMNEVANILNNATANSLIILDEVGRGTSTYDGLSIAWAVTEYISNPEKIGAKSLFATHYHELTELEERLPGVRNYNVAVKEEGDDVVFLHKIIPGEANQSYGIEVAKLAGVPSEVTNRSKEILDWLEEEEDKKVTEDTNQSQKKENQIKEEAGQLALFQGQTSEVVQKLSKLDIMSLTPLEAMNKLHQLQQKAQEEVN